MARRKRNQGPAPLQRFDDAANRSEQSLHEAREIIAQLGQARTDADRRRFLSALIEALMDASFELGKADAYLRQAGRKDPFKVPRYAQITELFTETWKGARAQRVANLTDRGRAAFASGIVSAAGAILGGVVAGPAGALAGSIAGGAIGPYAFMREMRDLEDLGDAVLGGGVGGIFSPAGAAIGAYWAGDELVRRGNPSTENIRDLTRRLKAV